MKLKEIKNTVVNVKTQAEYNWLMNIYEKAGWVWFGGNIPTSYNGWKFEEKNTCVPIENLFSYCDKDWYQGRGYKIISLSQFKKLQHIDKSVQPKPKSKAKKCTSCIQVTGKGGKRGKSQVAHCSPSTAQTRPKKEYSKQCQRLLKIVKEAQEYRESQKKIEYFPAELQGNMGYATICNKIEELIKAVNYLLKEKK